MMSTLIQSPWLAAPIAVALWFVWKWRRRRLAGVASAAWAGYCLYEYLMYARVLCSGECNIRIDLLVIYPILLVVTAAALVQSVVSRPLPARSISTDH